MKQFIIVLFLISFSIFLIKLSNATEYNIQIFPNSTNKAFVSTTLTSQNQWSSATSELSDANYGSLNVSDADKFPFSVTSARAAARYRTNIYNFYPGIESDTVDNLTWCIELNWNNNKDCGVGYDNLFYYDVTMFAYTNWYNTGCNATDNTYCIYFDSTNITDIWNTTDDSLKFGTQIMATPLGAASTTTANYDYIYLNISYTVEEGGGTVYLGNISNTFTFTSDNQRNGNYFQFYSGQFSLSTNLFDNINLIDLFNFQPTLTNQFTRTGSFMNMFNSNYLFASDYSKIFSSQGFFNLMVTESTSFLSGISMSQLFNFNSILDSQFTRTGTLQNFFNPSYLFSTDLNKILSKQSIFSLAMVESSNFLSGKSLIQFFNGQMTSSFNFNSGVTLTRFFQNTITGTMTSAIDLIRYGMTQVYETIFSPIFRFFAQFGEPTLTDDEEALLMFLATLMMIVIATFI